MMFFNIFFNGLELQHRCWQNLQTTLSDKQQRGQLHSDRNSLEGWAHLNKKHFHAKNTSCT